MFKWLVCATLVFSGVALGWTMPVNLGAVVNTAYSEAYPGVTTDGQKLYFDSDRTGGYGSGDIWVTDNTTGVAPASLGAVKALFR